MKLIHRIVVRMTGVKMLPTLSTLGKFVDHRHKIRFLSIENDKQKMNK